MSDSRHTSASGRSRRAQRGASVIEATLVLMLALMFACSIFDFGHVLFIHQTLAHQVREAARYAALHPDETDRIRNILLYGNGDGGTTPFFGLTADNVTIVPPGAFNPVNPQPRRIQVTLAGYRYPLITPFVAGTFTGRPITVSIPIEGE